MKFPIVISTWPFGMAANEAAWSVLSSAGSALDSVIAGATQCEDDPAVDSVGLGGLPDADGEVTLDASVMDHRGRCGAVACMKRIQHAAQVARLVIERTPHVMLAGEAATQFAIRNGMQECNLLTDKARLRFQEWKRSEPSTLKPIGHDTLGILAIDMSNQLAGACTTSGLAFKLPGRVGDSPLIGAGLYVDGKVGAVTATGQGEEMIKSCASFSIVENLRRGMEPPAAIAAVLERLLRRRNGDANADVSFLALRADGRYAGMTLNAKTNFRYAVIDRTTHELVDAPALVRACMMVRDHKTFGRGLKCASRTIASLAVFQTEAKLSGTTFDVRTSVHAWPAFHRGEMMKPRFLMTVFCSLIACTSNVWADDKPAAAPDKPLAEYKPKIDKDGWEILFDGKDLNAWQELPDGGGWEITDKGELHVAKKGPNLFTRRRYCDFVIECDFKVASGVKSNSGVFIHTHDKKNTVHTGMEIQILDDASYKVNWDAMNANGALYDLVHPSVSASNPPGEWNHFRIAVNGPMVTVEMNGKEIVKADLDQWTTPHQNPDGKHNKYNYAIGSLPREGFIGLQNYGGVPVWFREIRVKPLTDRQPKYTGAEPITEVLSGPGKK